MFSRRLLYLFSGTPFFIPAWQDKRLTKKKKKSSNGKFFHFAQPFAETPFWLLTTIHAKQGGLEINIIHSVHFTNEIERRKSSVYLPEESAELVTLN